MTLIMTIHCGLNRMVPLVILRDKPWTCYTNLMEIKASHDGDINWPSRSPDLTAPDLFHWVYFLNKRINLNKPWTIDALRKNITDAFTESHKKLTCIDIKYTFI